MTCSNINETEHDIERKTPDTEVYILIYIKVQNQTKLTQALKVRVDFWKEVVTGRHQK